MLFKLFKSVTSRYGCLNTCLLSKFELRKHKIKRNFHADYPNGGWVNLTTEDRFSESIGLKQD